MLLRELLAEVWLFDVVCLFGPEPCRLKLFNWEPSHLSNSFHSVSASYYAVHVADSLVVSQKIMHVAVVCTDFWVVMCICVLKSFFGQIKATLKTKWQGSQM